MFTGLISVNPQLGYEYFSKTEITRFTLPYLPVPKDFRNYFLLQSFGDTTTILIGDFVGQEKRFCLIIDRGHDNKIDEVHEYLPDIKKFIRTTRPSTDLFTNIKEIKEKIIDGSIFRESYSHKMSSLGLLKMRLSKGRDIFKKVRGYTVEIHHPERARESMSEFFFGKNYGKYDLMFATYYYRIFHTRITPPLVFSVYCKESTDPVIEKVVESLLKQVGE